MVIPVRLRESELPISIELPCRRFAEARLFELGSIFRE
jgi:Asp-tRNA(Asn)/Glu-tRNA(Gln) amidotransferase A subunit family amidase